MKQISRKEILNNNIPDHIAIIMDGNGRWDKRKNLPRLAGHNEGINSVREIVRICGEIEVKYLTLFAFSIENWERPSYEVETLMRLLVETLRDEFEDLFNNNIRLNAIGDVKSLPNEVKYELDKIINNTKDNTGMTLTLALSYGGKQEIFKAVKEISEKVKNEIICLDNLMIQSLMTKHKLMHLLRLS